MGRVGTGPPLHRRGALAHPVLFPLPNSLLRAAQGRHMSHTGSQEKPGQSRIRPRSARFCVAVSLHGWSHHRDDQTQTPEWFGCVVASPRLSSVLPSSHSHTRRWGGSVYKHRVGANIATTTPWNVPSGPARGIPYPLYRRETQGPRKAWESFLVAEW